MPLMLNNAIMKTVKKQVRSGDPPCVKEVYDRMIELESTPKQALQMICAAGEDDLTDMISNKKPLNLEHYTCAMEDLLRCFQYDEFDEAEYSLLFGIFGDMDPESHKQWRQWRILAEEEYDLPTEEKPEKRYELMKKAADIFFPLVEKRTKTTLRQLDIEFEDLAEVESWLYEYVDLLSDMEKYEEELSVCRRILNDFSWKKDGDDRNFRLYLGEALDYAGRKEESIACHEELLADYPGNSEIIGSYAAVIEKSDPAKAYGLLKPVLQGVECNSDNAYLFNMARDLSEALKLKADKKHYDRQLDKYHKDQKK